MTVASITPIFTQEAEALDALAEYHRAGLPCPPAPEMAEVLGVFRTNVPRLWRKLEAKGLVKFTPGEGAEFTEYGLAILHAREAWILVKHLAESHFMDYDKLVKRAQGLTT